MMDGPQSGVANETKEKAYLVMGDQVRQTLQSKLHHSVSWFSFLAQQIFIRWVLRGVGPMVCTSASRSESPFRDDYITYLIERIVYEGKHSEKGKNLATG